MIAPPLFSKKTRKNQKMVVKFKRITLKNFKGIRDLSVNFNAKETTIAGGNGTGKSTIFDAVSWVLFGKDAQGRKQFDIKTLDENGVAIPKIEHSVELVLSADEKEITLRRTFNEKYSKKRGGIEDFIGHEEERFFNEVPCSVRDYTEKVSGIIAEEKFKILTNVGYFTALKPSEQRAILFEIVKNQGGITDAQIAFGNDDFNKLLGNLEGKTMDEFKREVSAKKKRIKSEADGIPARIEERQKDINGLDEKTIKNAEKELLAAKKELETISAGCKKDAMLAEINSKIAKLDAAIIAREAALNTNTSAAFALELEAYNAAKIAYETAAANKVYAEQSKLEKELQLQRAEEELNGLRAEYAAEKGRIFNLSSDEILCPTCGAFVAEYAEKTRSGLEAQFNAAKEKRLSEIQEKGKNATAAVNALKSEIKAFGERLESIEKTLAKKLPAEPQFNAKAATLNDAETLELVAKKTALQEEAHNVEYHYEEEDTTSQKAALETKISESQKVVLRSEIVKENTARVAELQAQLQKLGVDIARLERWEYICNEFSKARAAAFEDALNSLFEMVTFKLFSTQINGEVTETCEATINGVPFSSANTAARINAGIDIINAISAHEGISAPIIVDNSESVNSLTKTSAQLVKLVVSQDAELKIS